MQKIVLLGEVVVGWGGRFDGKAPETVEVPGAWQANLNYAKVGHPHYHSFLFPDLDPDLESCLGQ